MLAFFTNHPYVMDGTYTCTPGRYAPRHSPLTMLWFPLAPGSVTPIVRIPLLVTAGVLYRIASRPPNPASNHAEISRYGGQRDLFSRPWVWAVVAYGIQVPFSAANVLLNVLN